MSSSDVMTPSQKKVDFVKEGYRSWKFDPSQIRTKDDDTESDVVASSTVHHSEQDSTLADQEVNIKPSDNLNNSITKDQKEDPNSLLSKEDIIIAIKELVGLQEKFFYLVLENCNANKTLQTNRLKMPDIAEAIQCNSGTAKYAISNIVNKGLVKRLKGRGSVNSFVQFEITREVKKIGNVLMIHKRKSDLKFDEFLTKARHIGSLMNWYNDLSKKSDISIDSE
jgi:DNA-binding MarR family transcriptional regulator